MDCNGTFVYDFMYLDVAKWVNDQKALWFVAEIIHNRGYKPRNITGDIMRYDVDFMAIAHQATASTIIQWIGFVGKIFTGNHRCSHQY